MTKTALFSLSILIASALGASAASAKPSLQDKKEWAKLTKELNKAVKATVKVCGKKLTAKYDVKSFSKAGAGPLRAKNNCELGALNAIKAVCATDLGKKAVAKNIKSMTCSYSADGTKASLAKKKLTVHIDPNKGSIVGDKPGSYSWLSAIKERLHPLEDMEEWAKLQGELDAKLVAANAACGGKLTARYDVESFSKAGAGPLRAKNNCELGALNALTAMCNTNEESKATIASDVTKLSCRYSGEGTKATREGKTLTIHIDPNNGSITGKKPGSYSWTSAIEELL